MNKTLTKLTEEMTPKQAKFFSLWLKHGNGTLAAMETYDCKDETTASVIASENLVKLKNPVKTFLETNGLSLSYLTKIYIDASVAQKRDQFSGEMYPDHKIRMEAGDRIAKWLGVENEKEELPQQTNIQINVTRGEE